jgi:2-oxoglutarate dehydrogenase E2 component (dihydrolipoamide succinyltransferase)
MALELKIPSVGESVTTVTISQWLKKDGEYVEMDEHIAELESDKATVELNATASGILSIAIEEGSDVEIGAVVASIDTSAKAPAKKADSPEIKEKPAAEKPTAYKK